MQSLELPSFFPLASSSPFRCRSIASLLSLIPWSLPSRVHPCISATASSAPMRSQSKWEMRSQSNEIPIKSSSGSPRLQIPKIRKWDQNQSASKQASEHARRTRFGQSRRSPPRRIYDFAWFCADLDGCVGERVNGWMNEFKMNGCRSSAFVIALHWINS